MHLCVCVYFCVCVFLCGRILVLIRAGIYVFAYICLCVHVWLRVRLCRYGPWCEWCGVMYMYTFNLHSWLYIQSNSFYE
jgi:hypothetical protein